MRSIVHYWKQQGKNEEKKLANIKIISIAKKMQKESLSLETIMKTTVPSKEKVEKLK